MKSLILQDIVLNQIRREREQVVVTLCTGQRICGTIHGFDNFTVIFDLKDGRQIMAYKQSIACIEAKRALLGNPEGKSLNS